MKSPLKSKPLNNPGQSLEVRLNDIAVERVYFPLTIMMFALVFAAVEWIRWYSNSPPNPLMISVMALLVVIWTVYKVARAFKEAGTIKQGIAGEKAVGQFLERLRSDGAEVFHDIQGENFNLDHVVIHRSGVYVVETKTMKKPASGKTELTFDGEQVLFGNKPLPRNPVPQVSAASAWLKELLAESSGRKIHVRGIVTFPGWYVRSSHNRNNSRIWVLNPKAIPSFISKQSDLLSPEDVHLLKFHLGKFIRATP
ncbi:MAG: NERD domain-containing protein [Idiomarina sp.]|nr:NERD domain-containing protein [Idiomarina sp.]